MDFLVSMGETNFLSSRSIRSTSIGCSVRDAQCLSPCVLSFSSTSSVGYILVAIKFMNYCDSLSSRALDLRSNYSRLLSISRVNNRRRSIPSLKDKQESMKMHKSVDLRLRQSAHINMSRQAAVPKNSTNMVSKPGGRGEHRYMHQSYLYRMQSVSPQMRS